MRHLSLILALLVGCGTPEVVGSLGGVDLVPRDGQQAPVRRDLVLQVSRLIAGEQAQIQVMGAAPGEPVMLLRGRREGAGPCAVGGQLCLDLLGPISVLATVTADASGVAMLTAPLPDTLQPGTRVSLQAVVLRGASFGDSSVSDAVTREITAPPVRFVAMGDGGEGNAAQYQVADAVGTVCAQRGCEFVLYLGDNFYDDGVTSVTDPQFQTKFEQPYANLELPFHVVTGNHDFGEIPLQFWRTNYQIEYSDHSDKWSLPDNFYSFQSGDADFFALDTNIVMLGLPWREDPAIWMDDALAASTGSWRVAYGHHPYLSNGQHGNAGNYEGVSWEPTGLVNGENVQGFMEDHVCGQVDLYLCGHDHNRQWLVPTCGTEFVVVGSASKTTDLVGRDNNPTIWEDDTREGFAWIELDGDTMTIAFYDLNGQLDHEGSVTR